MISLEMQYVWSPEEKSRLETQGWMVRPQPVLYGDDIVWIAIKEV